MSRSHDMLIDRIRYAREPDNFALISEFLSRPAPSPTSNWQSRWAFHERQYRLLLDTMADELLPAHWRQGCLNQIYQPLMALGRLVADEASQRRLHALNHELSMISHHLKDGLTPTLQPDLRNLQ